MTPKQTKFLANYLACGNASEAYRLAYDAKRMKPETVNSRAHDLLRHGQIAASIEAAHAKLVSDAVITVEGLTKELLDTAAEARGGEMPGAAVMAYRVVARLHGLDVKRVQDVTRGGEFKMIRHLPEEPAVDVLSSTTMD